MKKNGKVLIVDDDEDILTAGKLLLKRHFSHVSTCNLPEHIPLFIKEQSFDVILLDMNFGPGESSGAHGLYWLQQIMAIDPSSIVILITAHGSFDIAVEAMKLGATDFIAKPWQNEKMIATVSTAVALSQSRHEAKQLRVANQALAQASNQSLGQTIIGQSASMEHVHSLIARCAPTDANVMILGENGTGKELIAREIHQRSTRADQVFMSVDLGAIAESLFESELFGHKKGAFTGAQKDRMGRLLAADGGTLFLDEIGNLPMHLQAKLLTVLEQRKVTPIGENEAIPFDVRVISATNVAITQLCDEQYFRQDLRFRLNTVEINLPSLRERRDDIEAIANHYIGVYCKKYHKPTLALANDALCALRQYTWPGNIRELKHTIERAVILCQSSQLSASDFQLAAPTEPPIAPTTATLTANEAKKTDAFTSSDSRQEFPLDDDNLNLEQIEKVTVARALKKHRYNISHAAKELGLTRAALYRRMEKHGL
ncbi:sigma-54-dependent transcriptional regulator [Thalassotalea fusca]